MRPLGSGPSSPGEDPAVERFIEKSTPALLSKPSLTILIVKHGAEKITFTKVTPIDVGKVEFGIY
jgi:hypothetical protein